MLRNNKLLNTKLKCELLSKFVELNVQPHLQLYNPDMEVQVNVSQGKGEKYNLPGRGGFYYTDGNEIWKHFRIPFNAKTNPNYTDTPLKFNLEKHIEGIGLSGWDWKNKQSIWFGYDIDSIVSHKEGLNEKDIDNLISKITGIPYVKAIKSTSGKGIHLYIHLDKPYPTNNHTEHAALSRSILSVMSIDACFNFSNVVDVCGMTLWIWHKRANNNPHSFKLIKEGTKFDSKRIPDNWKLHLDVISGNRRKTPSYCTDEDDRLFQLMTSATRSSMLSEKHEVLLKWFKKYAQRSWWWDNDHQMLVCHTLDLKLAHTQLDYKGVFYTNSSGSSDQNCYAFPYEEGSWIIRRHSRGVNEHPSWTTDPSGWTRCNYNCASDLGTCIRSNGGLENAAGDFIFENMDQGLQALHDLGVTDIGELLKSHSIYKEVLNKRKLSIKQKKDNKIVLSFERLKDVDDKLTIKGFVTNKRGNRWERVITIPTIKKMFNAPDHLIRHLIAYGEEAGWFILTKKGWIAHQRCNVVTVLESQTFSVNKKDVEAIMSKAVLDPWELVNIPFADEYPGSRQWNMDAASFTCNPKEGSFDTWETILTHLGKNIDNAVEENEWCKMNEISNGRDYLFYWIANMFQRPTEPLPYLFFVGPQNCGKSTLHESLSLLMKRGYVRADNALNSNSGFNAEVANAVLCVVEETDLSKNHNALNRIKDWVTGKRISIRALYKNSYDIINTSHWIQCANYVENCPILPGDTRIVPINVDLPKKEIPKAQLFSYLEKEKRAFLHECLKVHIPDPAGRLGLPCITTSHKAVMEERSSNLLAKFMKEKIKVHLGKVILFNDFYGAFYEWLDDDQRQYWTKVKVGKYFPVDRPYCKGRHGGSGSIYLGNITFDLNCKDTEVEECYTDLTGRIKKRICH